MKRTLIFILAGLAVGTAIGLLGVSGVIPRRVFETSAFLIIKGGIGLTVLTVDLLCIWALILQVISCRIDKSGERAEAVIEEVRCIPRPDQLGENEWRQKARFVLTVSYQADDRSCRRELPPSFLTSRQELCPLNLKAGEVLPVRYSRRFPSFVQADDEKLKAGRLTEQQSARIHLIMIPCLLTLIYITALIAF